MVGVVPSANYHESKYKIITHYNQYLEVRLGPLRFINCDKPWCTALALKSILNVMVDHLYNDKYMDLRYTPIIDVDVSDHHS